MSTAPSPFSLASRDYTSVSFVRRPGYGKVGKNIPIVANHYAFQVGDMQIFHYDVKIDPLPTKSLSRKIWVQWEQNFATKNKWPCAYDGVANVFTPKKLPQDTMTFEVVLPPPADKPKRRDGKPNSKSFNVIMRKAAEVNLADLNAFLAGKTSMSNNILTALQAIDVTFHQKPRKTWIGSGRSFYDPRSEAFRLSGGLELLSGVFLSARPGVKTMTLNVDMVHTAFYQSIPVVQFCAEVLGRPLNLLRGQELSPNDHRKLDKAVRMITITTTHRGNVKTRYGVLKLHKTSAIKSTFTLNPPPSAQGQAAGDSGASSSQRGRGRGGAGKPSGGRKEAGAGEVISVADYFSRTYNIKLQYPHLPCLVVGSPAKQTFLPLELATIEPGQKFRGKLSEDHTAEIIKITAKKPLDRKDLIERLVSRLELDKDTYTKSLGINVEKNMMNVTGRLLPTPQLDVGGKSMVPRDGAWNFAGQHIKSGARISSLGVLSFVSPQQLSENQLADTLDGFFAESKRMGIAYNPNKKTDTTYPIHIARPGLAGVESAMRELWKQTGDHFKAYPELLIVILPRREIPLYAEVKRVGEILLGVPTQCLLRPKIARANPQYWANVALKVNVKIKGASTNFILNRSKYLSQPTMLLGMDVTHAAPGTNQSSIAAMVGSLDPNCARYATVIRKQPTRQEDIEDAGNMFGELLEQYRKVNNGRLPERLIIYRDGVSDGEMAVVRDKEFRAIKKVLNDAGASATKVTFMVVQKRHHTRFFAAIPQDTDRSGNVKAGLVVDNCVTNPTDFDFFLQSQAGLQGTSRPTRYVVIHDDIKWTPDDLQLFTYHLCYTYARCTRSVSVAPPAYYAHLVCFRARHHVTHDSGEGSEVSSVSGGSDDQELPPLHPKLETSMFFM